MCCNVRDDNTADVNKANMSDEDEADKYARFALNKSEADEMQKRSSPDCDRGRKLIMDSAMLMQQYPETLAAYTDVVLCVTFTAYSAEAESEHDRKEAASGSLPSPKYKRTRRPP